MTAEIYTSASMLITLTPSPAILDATNQVLIATSPEGAVATFNITATNICQPHI